MTFDEWWDIITYDKMSDNRKWLAEQAWKTRVPEGYVLVPVEPTEKMLSAVDGNDLVSWDSEAIYKTMIQTAQEGE